jgi:hypothetical protein
MTTEIKEKGKIKKEIKSKLLTNREGSFLMKYQWLNKKVDLLALKRGIEEYFKVRKFHLRCSQSENTFEILATKRVDHLIRRIKVLLYGKPNNFVVEFLAGKHIDSIQKADVSFELFGGGIFVLKAYEAWEYYQRLEREFWKYIEMLVVDLVNSVANNSTSNS